MQFPLTTLIRLYEFLKNSRSIRSIPDQQQRSLFTKPLWCWFVCLVSVFLLFIFCRSSLLFSSSLLLFSISSCWWRMTGSNRRPPACKAGALPAELIPRSSSMHAMPLGTPRTSCFGRLVGLVGLEPTTPALSRRCSNQLSYRPLVDIATTATPTRLFQQPISVDV